MHISPHFSPGPILEAMSGPTMSQFMRHRAPPAPIWNPAACDEISRVSNKLTITSIKIKGLSSILSQN